MPLKPQSICVNTAIGEDKNYGAVVPPLYLSTTYNFQKFGQIGVYDYSRSGNPNRKDLADTLARLEGGFGAVITSSGMAALDLLLNLLPSGAKVIAPHDLYGGTHRLFLARARQGRINLEFVDLTKNTAPKQIIQKRPDLLLIETPSNPLMRISDIADLCRAAHQVKCLVAVDNTFMSPIRQNPINLGADFVIHSTTKFINGHSDIVGGAVIAKHGEHFEELEWWANTSGVTASPFDCYQCLRGLRTLYARMDIQEKNAQKLAKYLREHKCVKTVYYPDGKRALSQQSGSGAIISFELDLPKNKKEKPINHKRALSAFFSDCGLFSFAESLGGTESLVCHPSSMTHRAMDRQAQKLAGISKNLIRISVGLEDSNDQISSLDKMLKNLDKIK